MPVLLTFALLVTGCDPGPAAPAPARSAALPAPAWQPVALPQSQPGGRQVLRDLAGCAGHWYAVGGYSGVDGATSPAAWASSDGRTFSALPTQPTSAYGPAHLLLAVACRGEALVAYGGTSGGVHGNPRTGTWWRADAGPLTEAPAEFELYGGPEAIGVGRVAAGTAGFVLAGARRDANGSAGAADWWSTNGRDFHLVDADPELESDARGLTSAQDVVGTADGFVLVGSLGPAGRPRTGLAWTSPDGRHWRRERVPAGALDVELQRVIAVPGGLIAVGIRGDGFGAWRRSATGWQELAGFGSTTGTGLPRVTGLASDGTRLVAVVADGDQYRLWISRDGTAWVPAPLPQPVPASAEHRVTVAGTASGLLLAADDRLYRS